MTAAAPTDAPANLGAGKVAGVWVRHLLSFYFPLNATLYLVTGPHAWGATLLFVVPLIVAFHLDNRPGRVERRQPVESLPAWPFDAIVYALSAVQFLNIVLLAQMFSAQGALSLDFLIGPLVIVGAGSGFSIITAHELIHRRPIGEQWLGRLLLCTVLYEHFYTEHLRGHHLRVGTSADPATARFGERFIDFYRRTVPAQFANAWRLEKKRLGDESMPNLDPRMLRHRVLHGLLAEWGLALGIGLLAGPVAFFAFLLQALTATRLLEIVNYFEHWGLDRGDRKRVRPTDSWDTHSWFTYYALVGLSRHADHHAYAARPYQQLRVWEEPPILPSGYVGTIGLVLFDNRRYRELCTEELERRKLGPFVNQAA